MTSSHPRVEVLLAEHGHTAEGREAAREAILESAIEQAQREARFCGLSLNCVGDTYAGAKHHRCRNDGTTCLCPCHDPKPMTAGDAGALAVRRYRRTLERLAESEKATTP